MAADRGEAGRGACGASGCSRLKRSRFGRWCSMHSARVYRHGSLNAPARRRTMTLAEFVNLNTATGEGCWEWLGPLNNRGYGQLSHDGRVMYAHRAAYEVANGPIPDGLFVCHRCDNRKCIRVDHLFLGTAFDNMADAAAKMRLKPALVLACKKGHVRTPENTCVKQDGSRYCRVCRRAWMSLNGRPSR